MENNVLPFPQEHSCVPFDTFVIKVSSRCNLNCSYCYMYNLEDRTWRGQPGIMKPAVREALGLKIKSHAMRHHKKHVHMILHGGEPLLMGIERMREWIQHMRATLQPEVTPWFSIQSNGVLVNDDWIDMFVEQRVGIGISVDGPRRFHDNHRLTHKGEGSYDQVIAAFDTFKQHPRGHEVFGNVMAVINTHIPPRQLFDFWMEIDVPGFDITLPHANHTHRPPVGAMSYGEWMVEFFDLWFDANEARLKVRYFENILRMLFGYPISTDNIGGKPVGVVVVETDGSIEPTDAFKSCDNGLTKLDLNVIHNEFDDLYGIDMVRTLQNGASTLCDTCQRCELRDICGGGYMPHRYRQGEGFNNVSVYCEDISRLVRHIRTRVLASLPHDIKEALHYG